MSIDVSGVVKHFGGFTALRGIDLHVPTGSLVALLGPSGSGKTTLLRIIAGLETADAGRVLFAGEDVTERHVGQRRLGFVFQHYALFRHMSVFENIAFGLRVKPAGSRPPEAKIRARVEELLSLVKLDGFGARFPHQLSGGQRQRVALARALAVEPQVLLLDEPFGALDARVRRDLRAWLRRLHDELHMTSVFVTHDQEEALEVADRVVVMNEGRIEQEGTPEEVYDKPANPFVFNFLGSVNLFHGRVEDGRLVLGAPQSPSTGEGGGLPVYVRPHRLDIAVTPEPGAFPAKVRYVNAAGPVVKLDLVAEWGQEFLAEMPRDRFDRARLSPGDQVWVAVRERTVFGAGAEDFVI